MGDTLDKIRKPVVYQKRDYNGHYGMHCKKTQLLMSIVDEGRFRFEMKKNVLYYFAFKFGLCT